MIGTKSLSKMKNDECHGAKTYDLREKRRNSVFCEKAIKCQAVVFFILKKIKNKFVINKTVFYFNLNI
jgi:hypothetical protein